MVRNNLEKFVSVLQFVLVATLVLRLFFAYEWLNSGIGKLTDISNDAGKYFSTMKNVIGNVWTDGTQTVKPNPYPWFASFLKNTIAPNVSTFITLVAIAETIIGICYLVGIFVRPAAVIGMFLNLTFFLASGHTSPSSAGINIIMFGGQLFFFIVAAGRAYGMDAVLHKRFPELNLF